MLADNPGTKVVTVFAGIPVPFDRLTDYDRQSSFTSSRNAMAERRTEDIRAMRVVKAEPTHLEHLDSQYGDLQPGMVRNDLARVISDVFGDEKPRVLGPLGIRHPDHVCVREALIDMWQATDMDLFLYDEIPYRVLWPEEAIDARESLDVQTEPVSLGVGSKDLKREAVSKYASQRWSTDMDCVFVPERFWRVQ